MDLNIYSDSCSPDCKDHHHQQHHKVEPGELLEDNWFFGNLLNTRTKTMSRSLSDPCTSSTFINQPGKSYEETYESIKKLSGEFGRANLLNTPSLPPRMERKDRKGSLQSDPARNKKLVKASSLHRAPSLPNKFGNEQEIEHDEEEEVEFSMGKLIRQASLNSRSSSNTLPPRTLGPKGVTASSPLSRHRSKKTPESRSPVKLDSLPETTPTRPQRPTHPLKSQKSLSYVESKQLQGHKEQTKSTLSRTMSSFQEKHRIDGNDAYSPDSWLTKSAAPPVPKWGGKKSREEDVKEQIKFWARAVASNVRQEC